MNIKIHARRSRCNYLGNKLFSLISSRLNLTFNMMPIDKVILQLLECAKEHECDKTSGASCAICIVGYNHIVEKPHQLASGRFICASCKDEGNELVKCDNDEVNSNDLAMPGNLLIETYKVQLFNLLLEKYMKAINLFEGEFGLLKVFIKILKNFNVFFRNRI